MLCLGTCFCSWLLLPAFWLLPWILCLLGFLWVCPCILLFFLVPILFCFPSCVLPCFSLLLFLSLPWILLELPFCTPLWILLVSSPSLLLGSLVFVGIPCFPAFPAHAQPAFYVSGKRPIYPLHNAIIHWWLHGYLYSTYHVDICKCNWLPQPFVAIQLTVPNWRRGDSEKNGTKGIISIDATVNSLL